MMRKGGEDVDRGRPGFAEYLDELCRTRDRRAARNDGRMATPVPSSTNDCTAIMSLTTMRGAISISIRSPDHSNRHLLSGRVGPLHDAGMSGEILRPFDRRVLRQHSRARRRYAA